MKLVAFSVRKFRSIVEAYKLSLGNYTVLVGPNNEGKSNIVKAIALSLTVLTRGEIKSRTRLRPVLYYHKESRLDYDWHRDFPVSHQQRFPGGHSQFTLEFEMTPEDFDMFRKQVGVNLTTNLKIKLSFGLSATSIEILMKGRGKKTLNTKQEQVAKFIRTHVAAEYISALRPTEMALTIVDGLIQNELAALEQNPEYKECLDQVQALQQPILSTIADKLQKTVSEFVPSVRGIFITNDRIVHAFRTSFNILVDDGARTDLAAKGDGIISLASMALMKHVSEESLGAKSLILSIEEPESHLHPAAIQGLRQVLKDISTKQQVIITTHSPILVEREHVGQNIIVGNGRAQKAKRMEDIREALGIQMADNLIGAYVVLLVEGETDRVIVSLLLTSLSPALSGAISRRLLVVDHLGGASKLFQAATFYKNNVYNIHVFMDNDDEGRKAIERTLSLRNVMEPSDYNLAVCEDMKDSELEDLLRHDAYSSVVQEKYGVSLNHPEFRSAKGKWSDRVERMFRKSGKIWTNVIAIELKRTIADACVTLGANCLNSSRKGPIDNLITALESKLAARGK